MKELLGEAFKVLFNVYNEIWHLMKLMSNIFKFDYSVNVNHGRLLGNPYLSIHVSLSVE